MAVIQKVDKDKLTQEQLERVRLLEREFEQNDEVVVLGDKHFLIKSFDYETCIKFSELRQEFRNIIMSNPNITMNDLLVGDNSIVKRILEFFGIDKLVDIEKITFKQFKYFMYVISKNYLFTYHEDSMIINALEPRWLLLMS